MNLSCFFPVQSVHSVFTSIVSLKATCAISKATFSICFAGTPHTLLAISGEYSSSMYLSVIIVNAVFNGVPSGAVYLPNKAGFILGSMALTKQFFSKSQD